MIGIYLSLAKASSEQFQEIEKTLDSAGVVRDGNLLHTAFRERGAVGIFDIWERREDFDSFVERSCKVVPEFEQLLPDVQFVEILSFETS